MKNFNSTFHGLFNQSFPFAYLPFSLEKKVFVNRAIIKECLRLEDIFRYQKVSRLCICNLSKGEDHKHFYLFQIVFHAKNTSYFDFLMTRIPALAIDGGLYLIPDNKAYLCPWIRR